MDNLNILLKYLVNSDDVTRIANAAGVEEDVVEKTCVLVFDALIPTDFTRQEGSHLEKKDLNAITSNFNKLLEGNSLKKIILREMYLMGRLNDMVALVVKELLVNIRGRLQYMTAAKKKPAPAPKSEPVKEELKAEPVRVQTRVLEEEQEVTEIKRPVRRSKVEESDETMEETWEKPEEPVKIKRPVRNKPRRFESKHESGHESDGHESSGYESDEEELSKGEKIALYVVGALLIAVIVVIVVILLKIKG